MSASTSSIPVCPHCQVDLTPDPDSELILDKDFCFNCGRKLRNPVCVYFQAPYYLMNQKKYVMENIVNKRYAEASHLKVTREVEEDLIKWVRECAHEQKIAPLHDALLIMENILFCQIPAADMNTFISTAKRIGKIAATVEEYFKSGGKSYDRKTRSICSYEGETTSNQAAATARGDS